MATTEIEVITFHRGRRYDEASPGDNTPEGALSCARQLLKDYMGVEGHHRRDFLARFYVDGEMTLEANAQAIAPLSDEEIALAILRKQGKLA